MPNKTLFNQVLYDILHEHPECEMAVYIDLQHATRLGTYTYANHSKYEETMHLMVNHVLESFNGKAFTKLKEHLAYDHNLAPDEEYFDKHTLRGKHCYFVYKLMDFNHNHAMAFMFSDRINRGLILKETKEFIEQIEEIAKKTEIPIQEHNDAQILANAQADANQHSSLNPPRPITEHPYSSKENLDGGKKLKKDIVNLLDQFLRPK